MIYKFCVPRNTNVDFVNFQKIKLFFDYFKDYDKSIEDLKKRNYSCSKEYYDYFTKYLDNYKQLYKECVTEYHPQKYFCKEFRSYYNAKHNKLISWSCNLTGSSEAPKLILQLKINAQKQPNELPVQGVHNIDGATSETTIITVPSNDKATSVISRSITSVATVTGLLAPFYLVYNVISNVIYTPANTWIKNILGRNKRTYHNPYADQELMANFSIPEDLYSERTRYKISYSPE
ncbi:CYIR protein [Plasmodium cynomolgi strain B]|uniref:CYIR protein n=1 Tax=Plasmodium cynomolgi (strain B) TaxID=1120755 RepID=K6UFE4_PLACD|nr:CYIR protein [Plasmodium cynomolgi strain B]GAB69956.1 CYIR protein [Plasmodium cynomolgi strain B]